MLYSLLIFLYGISWTIVYISFIRNGRKEKVYCMPFFCIISEIIWEGLYGITTLLYDISVQTFFNGLWLLFAITFLCQFIKYQTVSFPQVLSKWKKRYIIGASVIAIALQTSMFKMWSYPANMIYSSYIHTIIISFMILLMLWIRGPRGYDLRIAILKIIGDFSAMVLSSNLYLGDIEQVDIAIICIGLALVFTDVLFLISFMQLTSKSLDR